MASRMTSLSNMLEPRPASTTRVAAVDAAAALAQEEEGRVGHLLGLEVPPAEGELLGVQVALEVAGNAGGGARLERAGSDDVEPDLGVRAERFREEAGRGLERRLDRPHVAVVVGGDEERRDPDRDDRGVAREVRGEGPRDFHERERRDGGRLEEVLSPGRMKGLRPLGIVGEGDRVDDPVQGGLERRGHLRGEEVDGPLVLDVAHVHCAAAQERVKRPAALLRAHAVKDPRPLLLKRPADRPGDAALVGDAEYEERLALQAEETHGAAPGVIQATENSTFRIRASPRFIRPLMT